MMVRISPLSNHF